MFLMVTLATSQPIYRETLRSLPEKMRQERIQDTVQKRVAEVRVQIIQAAKNNQTETTFALFCLEPDYNKPEQRSDGVHVSYGIGDIHRFHLFQKDGPRYRFSNTWDELNTPTEKIVPRPLGDYKIGYELYSRNIEAPSGIVQIHKRLEGNPIIYISQFFKELNEQFPDITLSISSDRPSDGLFETECCPLYTVSW